MTRILVLGGGSAYVQLLAQVLAGKGVDVITAEGTLAEPEPPVFTLEAYQDLHLPELRLAPMSPAGPPMQELRRQSRFAQSAKQQSLRAKARRR
jgi:hypothetical protein